ncbi:Retinol dehydrogenase 13 like protein [Argiope bruennichi]|uniref:Retinol dehydrogenase 13 like protein n=1 Tax=Argiope bruennichi TaxID=94029 RepID=A0A8T0EJZ2_ARGBR|nr:Retinol dehydrogenase 13 like protein [Argiope bruennichi]
MTLGCFVYFRGFLFGRKCHSTARLNGKTVVITGGNTGIGKETALDLASRGAKVIIACRDVQKGYETVNDISEKVQKPDVVVKRLDLASFASIKSFAQDVLENEPYIHILINNADGHIDFNDINLNSNYRPIQAYCRSKLANILFTRELAKRLKGAKVILACRDVQKGYEAVKDISDKIRKPNLVVKRLDLASFASIKSFAQNVLENEPYIHILINNAAWGYSQSLTEDGYELQFGVNHLGHFLLTHLLLDRIKASAPARIINVSSIGHIGGHIDFSDINLNSNYHPASAYFRSKLANVLFTRELAKRLKGTGVTTYCLHPGAVYTGLGRHIEYSMSKFSGWLYDMYGRLLFKSPMIGAQTTIYCAVEEKLANESGHYYCDCTVISASSKAQDDKLARKLWDVSEDLIAKAL